jgi:phospholipase/lecithinase/hemolysin
MTGLIRSCLVRMSRAGALSALLAGALLGATAAHAASFDAEYVFGDSLSDNGNAAEAGGAAFPFPPSFHDSFTNGPVAAAVLAQSFGLNLEPSLWANGFMDVHNIFPPGFVPGTNYAFGGATASEGGTIVPGANLPDQVAALYGACEQRCRSVGIVCHHDWRQRRHLDGALRRNRHPR